MKYLTRLFVLVCLSMPLIAHAQIIKTDSFPKNKQTIRDRINKAIIGAAIAMSDTNRTMLFNTIEQLSPFQGKRINNIIFEQHNFSTNIDTPLRIFKDPLSAIGNRLHKNSKIQVLKKNLFFKEWDLFDANIIAYNEKWLRDLAFMQDARIIAQTTQYDTNQVDLIVITKDLFSLGGEITTRGKDAYNATINNVNFLGAGNRVQINQNFDNSRLPKTGYGYELGLNNVLGSFISINGGVYERIKNLINNEPSSNQRFITGTLPLLHPNSNWTGGFEFSRNANFNTYSNTIWKLDYTEAYNYKLDHTDFWVGYQFFRKKHKKNIARENRRFLQYRHFENVFSERPTNYLSLLDKNFQNIQANFISYTAVRQSIIRTKYLYGFGRNEDLPIGQSFSITAGKYLLENNPTPYLGFKFDQFRILKNGNYTHLIANAGSSYVDNKIQDGRFLVSLEQISKLKYLDNGLGYRQIINLSFTQTIKNKFNEALLINSIYGIPQLNRERIRGGTRISANWETVLYNKKSVLGFRSSPFVFGNITYIRTVGDPIKRGDIYTSIGSGIRIRNENLIFGTIELKGFYFPRTTLQLSPWNLSLITNLRFKYNSSIIQKPNFVEIN